MTRSGTAANSSLDQSQPSTEGRWNTPSTYNFGGFKEILDHEAPKDLIAISSEINQDIPYDENKHKEEKYFIITGLELPGLERLYDFSNIDDAYAERLLKIAARKLGVVKSLAIVFGSASQEEHALRPDMIAAAIATTKPARSRQKSSAAKVVSEAVAPTLDLRQIAAVRERAAERPWRMRPSDMLRSSPFEWVKANYGEWLGKGLQQSHLAADKDLYRSLRVWRSKHGSPPDVDLPTRDWAAASSLTERDAPPGDMGLRPEAMRSRFTSRPKPPLPTQARILFSDRANDPTLAKLNIAEFLRAEYGPWLDGTLMKKHLKQLDPSAYRGLYSWLRSNTLPPDIVLPTPKEKNDAAIAALGGRREVFRLNSALSRRAKGASPN